jgi:hypothetical protein
MVDSKLCPRARRLLDDLGATKVREYAASETPKVFNEPHRTIGRWLEKQDSGVSRPKSTVILPYREVYGKGSNTETWGLLLRHRSIKTVIQFPSGTLGIKNDQPFAFIHQTDTNPYGEKKVLFVDATQVVRASEHGHVLSQQAVDEIKEAVQTGANAGKVLARSHSLDANRPFYLSGMPAISKLVPRGDALPSEQTLLDDIKQNIESIEKLREKVRRLTDRS